MSSTKPWALKLLAFLACSTASLSAVTDVHAAAAATVVLSRASGTAGTPVTATYTAPGCGGGVAATVAFALDDFTGHQFGTTTMNPATCSASLTFPVAGSAGGHRIVGYVANSGAPVASAPFTILAAPPAPPPTPEPTPTPTPTPIPTPTLTPTPTATPAAAAQSSSGIVNSLLVPGLIAIIALLIIAVVVLLVLLRRRRSRDDLGTGPPPGA
ncbi:hypothetical protein [Candidatus Nephthysia bennettiae]|uniref:Bacterial Ig-like domain-containing protein n=1 Tax=Candidatus Nephthysia bennettiae TaxID=3127016 RepID=A0A934NBW8_9BACT|nr:hypothetical protein [Candidatus Dormibacteraeota bacterium]MBJ7614958.1 hypothetical protein [Candidatus Dormibacteraeota bacterium]